MKMLKPCAVLFLFSLAGVAASDKKAIRPDPNAPAMPFSPAIQAGGECPSP